METEADDKGDRNIVRACWHTWQCNPRMHTLCCMPCGHTWLAIYTCRCEPLNVCTVQRYGHNNRRRPVAVSHSELVP